MELGYRVQLLRLIYGSPAGGIAMRRAASVHPRRVRRRHVGHVPGEHVLMVRSSMMSLLRAAGGEWTGDRGELAVKPEAREPANESNALRNRFLM